MRLLEIIDSISRPPNWYRRLYRQVVVGAYAMHEKAVGSRAFKMMTCIEALLTISLWVFLFEIVSKDFIPAGFDGAFLLLSLGPGCVWRFRLESLEEEVVNRSRPEKLVGYRMLVTFFILVIASTVFNTMLLLISET